MRIWSDWYARSEWILDKYATSTPMIGTLNPGILAPAVAGTAKYRINKSNRIVFVVTIELN
jgi:hypothetical protein